MTAYGYEVSLGEEENVKLDRSAREAPLTSVVGLGAGRAPWGSTETSQREARGDSHGKSRCCRRGTDSGAAKNE